MEHLPIRRILVAIAMALALAAPVVQAAHAEDGDGHAESSAEEKPHAKSRKEEREERERYAIDARTGKIFDKVRAAIDAEDYATAEKQLAKLRLDRLSPFERAQALRLRG